MNFIRKLKRWWQSRKTSTISFDGCDFSNLDTSSIKVEGRKTITFTNCKMGDTVVNTKRFLPHEEYDNHVRKCNCGRNPSVTIRYEGADVYCACGEALIGDDLDLDGVIDLWNNLNLKLKD